MGWNTGGGEMKGARKAKVSATNSRTVQVAKPLLFGIRVELGEVGSILSFALT